MINGYSYMIMGFIPLLTTGAAVDAFIDLWAILLLMVALFALMLFAGLFMTFILTDFDLDSVRSLVHYLNPKTYSRYIRHHIELRQAEEHQVIMWDERVSKLRVREYAMSLGFKTYGSKFCQATTTQVLRKHKRVWHLLKNDCFNPDEWYEFESEQVLSEMVDYTDVESMTYVKNKDHAVVLSPMVAVHFEIKGVESNKPFRSGSDVTSEILSNQAFSFHNPVLNETIRLSDLEWVALLFYLNRDRFNALVIDNHLAKKAEIDKKRQRIREKHHNKVSERVLADLKVNESISVDMLTEAFKDDCIALDSAISTLKRYEALQSDIFSILESPVENETNENSEGTT